MRALLFCLLLLSTPSSASLVDAVDPFIGTGGHGHTFPGATVPFGMVQLSPDTRLTGWDGCSGYHYDDDVVYGFSHTHLSGTGVSDYGDILFMPVRGEVFLHNGSTQGVSRGYASHFDKEREVATPGYYSTYLTDYDTEVELTATARAGLHRYRFPGGKPTHVVLDLQHRDQVLDSQIIVTSDTEIIGFRRSSAWATDQVVYFVAQFSRPFRARLARDDEFIADADTISGNNCKAVLAFGRGGIWGLGLGDSRQKLFYLPEAHTDFIFSVITEEMGLLFGALVVLGLMTFILIRILRVATLTSDPAGRYIVSGIAAVLFFQTVVSVGMNLRLLPVTGLTLPFVSYGGSSLITLYMAVGIVQSVLMRHRKQEFG